jgi:environmental stress-induced protein Ves
MMPWKNGRGSTSEIAASPPDSTLETFDWRVSMATIDGDADFSTFPGVDRTLVPLGPAALTLRVEGDTVRLDYDAPPFVFRGESRVRATVERPSKDFNVMTRRARFAHRVRRVQLAGTAPLSTRAAVTLLFLTEGRATLDAGDGAVVDLDDLDLAVLDSADGAGCSIRSAGAALLVVEIDDAPEWSAGTATDPRRRR